MIDFHSHMLPGMDDGAKNSRESVEMLRSAARQGVRVQALTPHYYPWRESTESFLERRDASLRKLNTKIDDTLPELLIEAEAAFFPAMTEQELSPLCLDGESLLLVELPFESWGNQVSDVLATLTLDRGYRVILAHVERYMGYGDNTERLLSLQNLPVTMQMNCGAFLPLFRLGKAFSLAKRLGEVVLGTDAHNMEDRAPNMEKGRAALSRRLGENFLRRIDRRGEALLSGSGD